MQIYTKPFKKTNDHKRIVRTIRFRSSFKEINMLKSKGMSNIYVKATIKKNWSSKISQIEVLQV